MQVLRGKSLALDRIPLLGLSIFGIADEGGFDWSRDTAASICSPCIDVDPPPSFEIYVARRMGKFRENSCPPPHISSTPSPNLHLIRLFYLLFTRHLLRNIDFSMFCLVLAKYRSSSSSAAERISFDSSTLDFNV